MVNRIRKSTAILLDWLCSTLKALLIDVTHCMFDVRSLSIFISLSINISYSYRLFIYISVFFLFIFIFIYEEFCSKGLHLTCHPFTFLTWYFARITHKRTHTQNFFTLLPDQIPLEIGIVKHAISIKWNEYEAFSHIDSLNIFSLSSNLLYIYTYIENVCTVHIGVEHPNPFIG